MKTRSASSARAVASMYREQATAAMIRLLLARAGAAVILALAASPVILAAQAPETLPSPLGLADVVRLAGDRRDEIEAARARTRAGEARPDIVSALEDPMIAPSLDHLPFMLQGAD